MVSSSIKYFEIENQVEELILLAEKIEDLANEWNLPSELALNLNLVIEEAVTNIIFYAFNDREKHSIRISISIHKKGITIEITDGGIPFNPLKKKAPDVSLPLEERSIGGLGIFLISKIMDEVKYVRKNKQNILTLVKHLD